MKRVNPIADYDPLKKNRRTQPGAPIMFIDTSS
jgi:hypothetical protein